MRKTARPVVWEGGGLNPRHSTRSGVALCIGDEVWYAVSSNGGKFWHLAGCGDAVTEMAVQCRQILVFGWVAAMAALSSGMRWDSACYRVRVVGATKVTGRYPKIA